MPIFFILDCKVPHFSRETETSENWREKSTHRYEIVHPTACIPRSPETQRQAPRGPWALGQEPCPKGELVPPAGQATGTTCTRAGPRHKMRQVVPKSPPTKTNTQSASAEPQTPEILKVLPSCPQQGSIPDPSHLVLTPPGMLVPETSKSSKPNHPFQVELKHSSFQTHACPSPYPPALSIKYCICPSLGFSVTIQTEL